jgi:hypothetical protein
MRTRLDDPSSGQAVGAIAAAATIFAASDATAQSAKPGSTVVKGGMYYDPPLAIVGKAVDGQIQVRLTDGVKVSFPVADESLVITTSSTPIRGLRKLVHRSRRQEGRLSDRRGQPMGGISLADFSRAGPTCTVAP